MYPKQMRDIQDFSAIMEDSDDVSGCKWSVLFIAALVFLYPKITPLPQNYFIRVSSQPGILRAFL